jgi:hypothetical protein
MTQTTMQSLREAAMTCATQPRHATTMIGGKEIECRIAEGYRNSGAGKVSIRWYLDGKVIAAAKLEDILNDIGEERPEEAVETPAATSIATHPSERDGEAPEYLDEASGRDRDPADPEAVADELATWIEAQSSDDETERDEADLALDAVLLEQGVICPTDTIDWITWEDDFVTIGLAGGEEIRISRTTGELDA